MRPKIVARFCINGKYYEAGELPEEKVREFLEKRLEEAMKRIHYTKCK